LSSGKYFNKKEHTAEAIRDDAKTLQRLPDEKFDTLFGRRLDSAQNGWDYFNLRCAR
jgi:hypothetical protein